MGKSEFRLDGRRLQEPGSTSTLARSHHQIIEGGRGVGLGPESDLSTVAEGLVVQGIQANRVSHRANAVGKAERILGQALSG